MKVATTIFLILIRLRSPKSTLISDILRRKDGQSTLNRIQKFEELDYRLRKAELALEIFITL